MSYFDFIFAVSFSKEKLFSVRNSSEFDGFIFVLFLEVVSEFALFLKALDLQLILYEVFLVVFFGLELVLHRLDDLVEGVKFAFEEGMNIFALLGCANSFEEGREVFIEVD